MRIVNSLPGLTDNEVIARAIADRDPDGIVIIPPRMSDTEPERTYWLLDEAILLPANTTVILQNCTIKLSDRCRDNFFRTANCGMGIADPEKISNIHIKGEGVCVLQGADHPRATGDGSKILACPCPYTPEDLCRLADWIPEERRSPEKLDFWDRHIHTYGTDVDKEDESHYGDWRNIGVLFANTEHFSIENIRIADSHGWAISLEACAYGRVEKISFDACMSKKIDGMLHNMENQDGLDLRNGCHDIIISDITGRTGDDVVALTAIATDNFYSGGSLRKAHVMHNDWSRRDRDIHDIIIRNVIGYSNLCCIVRLLACNTHIWNVIVDNVIDASPDHIHGFTSVLLGEADNAYGKNPEDGMRDITISNVICNSDKAVVIAGYLKDSVITNVINKNPNCPTITVERENGLQNVQISNSNSRQ